MSKLLLVFLAIIAGLMGGLSLYKRISAREKYFDRLVALIDRLISDISYCQTPVQQIICGYECTQRQLSQNLDEYKRFLSGSSLNLSKGVLTKREQSLMEEFFLRLGTLDLDTQVNELNGRKSLFTEIRNMALNKSRTYGKAYIKLGFLLGLLIGILLL